MRAAHDRKRWWQRAGAACAVSTLAVAVPLAAGEAGCGSRTGVLGVGFYLLEGGPGSSAGAGCEGGEECCDGSPCLDGEAEGSTPDARGDGRTPPPHRKGCVAPSCYPPGPGRTNCGPSSECCCTSSEVPGGTFYRSYFMSGDVLETADPATVAGFRLDTYLVTVGRFREFAAQWKAGYHPPAGSGKHKYLNGGQGVENGWIPGTYETGWLSTDDARVAPSDENLLSCKHYATWTAEPAGHENLPINCVNWYEALAFCIWDGGFLPTDAESEFAAADGSKEQLFAWGNYDPDFAVGYAIYDCNYPDGTFICHGVQNIAPVGTTTQGQGVFGQYDLAGEVNEWLLDWGAMDFIDPCVNCANLTESPDAGEGYSGKQTRGGLFSSRTTTELLASARRGYFPSGRSFGQVGFRCARAP